MATLGEEDIEIDVLTHTTMSRYVTLRYGQREKTDAESHTPADDDYRQHD